MTSPFPNQSIVDALTSVINNGEIIVRIDRRGGPTIDHVISVSIEGDLCVIWYRPCHPVRQKKRIMTEDIKGFDTDAMSTT